MSAYRFELGRMDAEAQQLRMDAYVSGYRDGVNAGRQQVEAEEASRWAAFSDHIHTIAERPTYDQLAERRGQPARAEAHRRRLRERGIA